MLEAYSINQTIEADEPIIFNNISLEKGCTAKLNGASTIELNKCGVYMVAFNATTSAVTTAQLYKNGIAQPQAQSTGQSLSFTTLVQVPYNNTGCPCSSGVSLQVMNDTAATYDYVNIVITKVV